MPHAALTVMAGEGVPTCGSDTGAIAILLTYPLAKIAKKLGVKGVPDGEELPAGIWVSDGSEKGAAFNYIEIIDKLTERMSDAR